MPFTRLTPLCAGLAAAIALVTTAAAAQEPTTGTVVIENGDIGQAVLKVIMSVNSAESQKVDTVVIAVYEITTIKSNGKEAVRVTVPQAAHIKPGQVVALWRDTTAAAPQTDEAQRDTVIIPVGEITVVKPAAVVQVTPSKAADIKPGQTVVFQKEPAKEGVNVTRGVMTGTPGSDGQMRFQLRTNGNGDMQIVPAQGDATTPRAASADSTKKSGTPSDSTTKRKVRVGAE